MLLYVSLNNLFFEMFLLKAVSDQRAAIEALSLAGGYDGNVFFSSNSLTSLANNSVINGNSGHPQRMTSPPLGGATSADTKKPSKMNWVSDFITHFHVTKGSVTALFLEVC
jgi:hypothetical protein